MDIYDNIRNMVKTTWIPLLLSCAVYLVFGFLGTGGPEKEISKAARTRI
jgi:NhaC family Na+:H+ antiporter